MIRRVPLAAKVDTGDLASIRALTDTILAAKQDLTVVTTDLVRIAGADGIYYLYLYPTDRGEGLHAHYFLVSGRTLYTVVLQADSKASFDTHVDVFDEVVASLRFA